MDEKKKQPTKYEQQLGMPFGTACGRLKKMVMFGLLQKLEENFCYRCGEEIISVDDLTLDHKIPWRYADNELFWDLENVAFSHEFCNNQHKRQGNKVDWDLVSEFRCFKCREFKQRSEFYEDPEAYRGVSGNCKNCVASWSRYKRADNFESVRSKRRKNQILRGKWKEVEREEKEQKLRERGERRKDRELHAELRRASRRNRCEKASLKRIKLDEEFSKLEGLSELVFCYKCRKDLPRSEFHRDSKSKNKAARFCKSCYSEYQKRLRGSLRNKEAVA